MDEKTGQVAEALPRTWGRPGSPGYNLKHGLKPIHEAIVDSLIAEPTLTPTQLAQQFGYSVVGMRILMKTDAFREKLQERKGEIVDPLLQAKVEDRLQTLADLSIQRLLEKLENNTASEKLILGSADLATRALGYGARQPQVAVNNYVAVVPQVATDGKTWEAQYAGQRGDSVVSRADVAPLEPPKDV